MSRDGELRVVLEAADGHDVGVVLHCRHDGPELTRDRRWRCGSGHQGPEWELRTDLPNLDLATLCAYQLALNWQAA